MVPRESNSGGWLNRASRRDVLQATASLGVGSVVTATPVQAHTDYVTVWTFDTGEQIGSSPTVVDGTLYIGNATGLYALDETEGTKHWEFFTHGGVDTSPTVVDETVFFASQGRGALDLEDAFMYALDASDRSMYWKYPTDVSMSPTVSDETVCFGDKNGVYALDTTDAAERWVYSTQKRLNSSPTVVDGTIFLGSPGRHVHALDAADGTERWSFETGDRVNSSPTVADGTVFVGSNDGHVYALNASDGTEIWAYDTGDRVLSSPTVLDGTVFMGGAYNKLLALDAEDGTERWIYNTADLVSSSPTAVDSTVFVGSHDGHVYALNTRDGTERWVYEIADGDDRSRHTPSTGVGSSPIVVDGTLFVGSFNGRVYALDAGVDGSSEDSRVRLGTLNHHDDWVGSGASSEADDRIPWLRYGGGLAAIGGAGYLLKRRRNRPSSE